MPRKSTIISVIEATGAERAEWEEGLWPLFHPDDGLTFEAKVSARMVREDYGVPGSPTWYSPEDVEVESFKINGETFDPLECRDHFGPELFELLEAYALAVADSIEWEYIQ